MHYKGFHNAFQMLDTYGLPLITQMDVVEKHGEVIALDTFVRAALKGGWTFKRAIAKCREALIEKHGPFVGNKQADRLERGMQVEL